MILTGLISDEVKLKILFHAERVGRHMGCGFVWRIAQNWWWQGKVILNRKFPSLF